MISEHGLSVSKWLPTMFNSFDQFPYGIFNIASTAYLPQWKEIKLFTFAWSWPCFSKDWSSPDGPVIVEVGPPDVDGNEVALQKNLQYSVVELMVRSFVSFERNEDHSNAFSD